MSNRKPEDDAPLGKRLDTRKDVHSAGEFRQRAEALGFSSDEIEMLLKVYGPQYPLEPRPTR
ncbi:MAG: hypothetical protein AAFO77_04180 [Pseudomonadota bacterium]